VDWCGKKRSNQCVGVERKKQDEEIYLPKKEWVKRRIIDGEAAIQTKCG
jgi:hypothetical protein